MKGIKAARFNNRNWKNLKCQSRDCTNNKRCVSYRYQNPWQMDEKIRYSYCNPMFAEGGFTCYCLYFEKHWHFRCQLESQKVNVIDDNNSNDNINSNNDLVNIKVRFIDILKLFIKHFETSTASTYQISNNHKTCPIFHEKMVLAHRPRRQLLLWF